MALASVRGTDPAALTEQNDNFANLSFTTSATSLRRRPDPFTTTSSRTISLRSGVNTPWASQAANFRPALAAFVDMDGVLANQPYFHEKVAQTFLKKHGLDSDFADLHMLKRKGYDLWRVAINRVRSTKGVTESQVPDIIFKDQLREIESKEHRAERDACIVDRVLLKEFNSVIFVIIATNRDSTSTWSFLIEHNLEDCISYAYHRNDSEVAKSETGAILDYGLTKPHPDMLFRARKDFDLDRAAQYYMFGDQPSDMILARNAMRGDPRDKSMVARVGQSTGAAAARRPSG